jgi:hypothetical protein
METSEETATPASQSEKKESNLQTFTKRKVNWAHKMAIQQLVRKVSVQKATRVSRLTSQVAEKEKKQKANLKLQAAFNEKALQAASLAKVNVRGLAMYLTPIGPERPEK